ncbi:MAG: hypothetical protein IT373_29305 [Polyangiaceae bacterium]|nr:hypothetical protein [Polyangiaceae bacterium]
MMLSPRRILAAVLGLTTLGAAAIAGCTTVSTVDANQGGANAGGGGAAGTYCGEEYPTGPLYCTDTETCFSCAADWGGPDYDCRETPAPTPEQFACFFGVCTTASEYCALNPSPWCGGDFGRSCEPLPASCGVDPDCTCLETLPCLESCEVSPEGGLIVKLQQGCA